jgi:hypothetical protein
MNKKPPIIAAWVLAAFVVLSGCGGGGGGSVDGGVDSFPAKILRWIPPSSYTNSTPLDPSTDLDVFEIYLRTDGSFSASDQPMASLRAVDPATSEITTSFNLANLGPFISRGVTYYVAIRSVAKNGLKSVYSAPASFSY